MILIKKEHPTKKSKHKKLYHSTYNECAIKLYIVINPDQLIIDLQQSPNYAYKCLCNWALPNDCNQVPYKKKDGLYNFRKV